MLVCDRVVVVWLLFVWCFFVLEVVGIGQVILEDD